MKFLNFSEFLLETESGYLSNDEQEFLEKYSKDKIQDACEHWVKDNVEDAQDWKYDFADNVLNVTKEEETKTYRLEDILADLENYMPEEEEESEQESEEEDETEEG